MDILVTLPNGRTTFETGLSKTWWKVHRKPKKLNKADRVYFIEYGVISFYEIFTGRMATDPVDFSGCTLRGQHLVLDRKKHAIDFPTRHVGFQGFRYVIPGGKLDVRLRDLDVRLRDLRRRGAERAK